MVIASAWHRLSSPERVRDVLLSRGVTTPFHKVVVVVFFLKDVISNIQPYVSV